MAKQKTMQVTGAQSMLFVKAALQNQNMLAMIAVSKANPVRNRINLLSTNPALRILSGIGRKHRKSAARLRQAANQLIAVLDGPRPNAPSIQKAIQKIARETR